MSSAINPKRPGTAELDRHQPVRCLFWGRTESAVAVRLCLAILGIAATGTGPLLAAEIPANQGTQKELVYKKTKETDLKLFVDLPQDWQASDKRPAIVFFFGGGWTGGTVDQFADQASYLASRGMVAARADYRVKSRHNVKPDQCVEDAKSAVRYLRAHAGELGIDPNRIVSAGGSAGGHLAACTATVTGLEAEGESTAVSSQPNALLLFNPVLKFEGVANLMERIGGDTNLGRQISPTLHLHAKTPPALLFFGTDDRLIEQGKEFQQQAKTVGQRTELFTAPGVAHGFFNRSPWKERTLYRADEFLTSLGYLQGSPTFQPPAEDEVGGTPANKATKSR